MNYRQPESDKTVICDSSAMVRDVAGKPRLPQLVIVEGDVPGRTLTVDRDTMQIGREPDNEFVMSVAAVSRKHAVVSRISGSCYIKDLGAANGVFVNAVRLAPEQSQRLLHGDSVVMGTVRMLFLDPDNAAKSDAQALTVEQQQRRTEAESWLKRVYAIDPMAEYD